MLDADDQYSPGRLEALTRAGESKGADVVLDNQFVIDPISQRTLFLAFEPQKDDVRHLDFSEYLRNNQSHTFFDFGYLQPIVRHSWLKVAQVKYQEQLRHGEDLLFLFECYALGARVILVSTPYYHYYFQYSPSLKTKSFTTRTEVQYQALLDATDTFLARYQNQLSRIERKLFVSSCESTREAMIVEELRYCLRTSKISGMIACLLQPVRLFRGIYFAKRRSLLWKRCIRTLSAD